MRGRATDWMRGLHRLSSPDKLRMLISYPGSEGAGANVRVREGKNPDHRLRSPNRSKLKERSQISETARMLAWKQPFI